MPFKYIHYTGSTTLAILPMTGLRFVGLSNLMYQHRLSPLAGEVSDAIPDLAYHADIAFAVVDPSTNPMAYAYFNPKTAKYYASTSRGKAQARIGSESDLRYALDRLSSDIDQAHFQIQKLIADTMHAKQVGSLPPNGPLLPEGELLKYHADIEEIRKKTILSVNASYIFTVFMKSRNSYVGKELQDKIQQVLATGIIPINFVTLKREDQIAIAKKFYDVVFEGDLEHLKQDWKLADDVHKDSVSAEQLRLTDLFSASIADFNFKFAFLHNILDGKIGRSLSEEQLATVDTPFPMAIILTETIDDSMDLVKFKEYRCKRDLELGTDIKYMAVDPVNAEQLRAWLAKYNLLEQITLVDINTLEPIVSSERPQPRQ